MAETDGSTVQLQRVRILTGYAAHARFNVEVGRPLGYIHRTINQPYCYSPTHTVYAWRGGPIIICETRHRRYEVFRVIGTFPQTERAAMKATTRHE